MYGLSGFLVSVEEVVGKLAACKRIQEYLRVEESGAEFGDDLVGIIRDVRHSESSPALWRRSSMA